MNVARAREVVKGIVPTNFNKQDSYERSIQKQIETLQEKGREIANNKDLPGERKIKEKKEIEDQIMQLNQDLQRYKIQKHQKEEPKTQEQVNNIKKVRTELEGKLRTAKTDEDKIQLQDKIAELNEEISKRIGDNQNLIKDYHKEKQQDNKKNHQDTKLQDIKGEGKNAGELNTDKENTEGVAHAAGQDKEEEEEWKSVKERGYKNM